MSFRKWQTVVQWLAISLWDEIPWNRVAGSLLRLLQVIKSYFIRWWWWNVPKHRLTGKQAGVNPQRINHGLKKEIIFLKPHKPFLIRPFLTISVIHMSPTEIFPFNYASDCLWKFYSVIQNGNFTLEIWRTLLTFLLEFCFRQTANFEENEHLRLYEWRRISALKAEVIHRDLCLGFISKCRQWHFVYKWAISTMTSYFLSKLSHTRFIRLMSTTCEMLLALNNREAEKLKDTSITRQQLKWLTKRQQVNEHTESLFMRWHQRVNVYNYTEGKRRRQVWNFN